MKIQIDKQTLDVKPCTHFLQRFMGMMGKKGNYTYGFYFPKCSSIHTFFMRQSIDVIMVDKNNKIVAFYPNLKPWKIVFCKGAVACFEFSVGILKGIEIEKTIQILL